MALCTILPWHLAGILNNEIGRQFNFSLASDLKTGVTLALFHDTGNFPIWKDKLKSSVKGYDSSQAHSFRTLADMPSTPVDLVLTRFIRMSLTCFLDVETCSNSSGFITWQGNSMRPGTIFVSTVMKNSLNRCAFSVGFLSDLATLEYVTTSGSLSVFDLIEWQDQNFFDYFLTYLPRTSDIYSIWKK